MVPDNIIPLVVVKLALKTATPRKVPFGCSVAVTGPEVLIE